MQTWLGALVDAGADVLHCSQRRFWEPEFDGSDLNFAGWAKKLTGKPTITVGSVGLTGEFVGLLWRARAPNQRRWTSFCAGWIAATSTSWPLGRALLQDRLNGR